MGWHLKMDYTDLALALLQRTALRQISLAYSQLVDYDLALMRPYLPSKAGRILDIGAGIGAIDVRLHELYPAAHFYLLDKTGLDVEYGTETEQRFYSSQVVARELLKRNGVPEKQVHLLEATDDYRIGVDRVDLVVSLFSWGWHYPLGAYAAAVSQAAVKGGILILDVRNVEGKALLEKAFRMKASVVLQDGWRCFYERA